MSIFNFNTEELLEPLQPKSSLENALLKGYSTFFWEIGSFYNSPRVNSWVLPFSNPFS